MLGGSNETSLTDQHIHLAVQVPRILLHQIPAPSAETLVLTLAETSVSLLFAYFGTTVLANIFTGHGSDGVDSYVIQTTFIFLV